MCTFLHIYLSPYVILASFLCMFPLYTVQYLPTTNLPLFRPFICTVLPFLYVYIPSMCTFHPCILFFYTYFPSICTSFSYVFPTLCMFLLCICSERYTQWPIGHTGRWGVPFRTYTSLHVLQVYIPLSEYTLFRL